MQLAEFVKDSTGKLTPMYGEQEARAMTVMLYSSTLHVPGYFHVTCPDREIATGDLGLLEERLGRLCTGEPLQYVLGEAGFYGLTFKVSPAVLIPRPETELLCRMAIGRAAGIPAPHILDLCTGSGCIAWTLSCNIPGSAVTGADISEAALEVASSQDIRGCRPPEFIRLDLLAPADEVSARLSGSGTGTFDIIVSNPPYVMEKEKRLMHRNVLDYEPGCALFVPDRDPLVFYRAIAVTASRHLAKGGFGAVEINEALGREVSGLFSGAGFRNVEVRKDLSGRDRFVFFDAP